MSIAGYLILKCAKKIEENASLIVKKFSSAADALQSLTGSGPLAGSAAAGFGALVDEAGPYLLANADSLMLEGLKATGAENSVLDALNMFYNMLAQAVSAYNDLILIFLKDVAREIILNLEKKEEVNQTVKKKLQDLLDALLKLTGGDPAFDKYVADLRNALILLETGRLDIVTVRNTLDRQDRFLGKRFKEGRDKVEAGVTLLKPPIDQQVGAGILSDLGIPQTATGDQVNALLAVPKKCGAVIKAMQDYNERVTKINAMLVAYYAGLEQLQTGIPAVMKKFLLQRFDSTLTKLLTLVRSMGLVLNGDETARFGPIQGYRPSTIPVTVNAFKWAMDGRLVLDSFKLIPTGHVVLERQNNGQAPGRNTEGAGKYLVGPGETHFKKVQVGDSVEIFNTARPGTYRVRNTVSKNTIELDRVLNNTDASVGPVDYEITSDALGALQLNFEVVDAYMRSVTDLKALGTTGDTGAVLLANEAQENSVVFSSQLLVFLLEATNAVVSSTVRPEALALCRSFIHRCDLVTGRDNEIKAYLTGFINTPIPFEETIQQIKEGLAAMLGGLNLDHAADLLKNGEFGKFFGLNSKSATYIGAALEALALLKDCFDNDADKAKFSDIQNTVEGDADLLNFKNPLDFDLAIFNNLKDCIDLQALAGMLSTKEVICGLLEASGAETMFDKLNDVLSF